MDAIKQFDSRYPNTNDYDSWMQKGTYKYAISYQGKLYPPKFILSQASGFDVGDFWGGKQSNNVLRRLRFHIIPKP